jgi:membrane-associated protein
MNDQLLGWFSIYGLPFFFGLLVLSSAGIPFPITLTLVVSGAMVEQGEFELWEVLLSGISAAVIGDQIGYFLGWFGGRRLVRRLTEYTGGEEKIKKAEDFTRRWGGAGIFFSRWLITPLGPWINITSGITDYPWKRFLLWDVLGESLWVIIYVLLGKYFSDDLQQIVDFTGNLTWIFLGTIMTGILGWSLINSFRNSESMD